MKGELVSVVIPTRNSERWVEKCLTAIRNQSYSEIEIIVVDNFSEDSTPEIAKKLADKFIVHGGGMGAQVNRGVKEADGRYIAFFDVDMYLTERVIEECVDKCKNGYDAVIIPEITLHNSF